MTGFDRAAEERMSLEEADPGLFFLVDSSIVALANTLLATLATLCLVHPDWRRTLCETLAGEELGEAEVKIEDSRRRFRWGEPLGSIPHGTMLFGDVVVDLSVERRQLAVELLEVTGRLVQGGPGRGKCLVVLSAERLSSHSLGLVS